MSDLPATHCSIGTGVHLDLVPGDKIVGIIIPDKGITIYSCWRAMSLLEYENSPESWVKLDTG